MNDNIKGGMAMQRNRVDSIYLSGEDAENFAYSMFLPTTEEMMIHHKYIDEINQSILISEINHGFEADVDDLDLSFLHDNYIEVKMEVQVRLNTKMKPKVYNQIGASTEESYCPRNTVQYSKMPYGDNLIWAA